MDAILPIFFVIFFAFVCFTILSKKGKSFLFGGKIIKTMEGEANGKKRVIISTKVKVHVLEDKNNEKNIGLEIKQSGGLSYTVTPLTLTVIEARALVKMIDKAVEYEQ